MNERTTIKCHSFLATGLRKLFVALSLLLALTSIAIADETGMATIHAWRSEKGKVCMAEHFHSGTGEGRTKRLARRAAISDWQGFTAWEYGTDWARFSRSAGRSVEYSKSGLGWRATVQARACRPRPRRSRRTRRQ